MTSPAKPSSIRTPARVGAEENGGSQLTHDCIPSVGGVAALDPFLYQDMRWCERCAQMETFIEVYRLAEGALGYFLGCGDEKFVRFSRTVEAA